MALYLGLGITLLSDTTTLPFWRLLGQTEISMGGNAPFEANLTTLDAFYNNINLFYLDWQDSFSDPFNVWPIAPISCSGTNCLSLFLPGMFDPQSLPVSQQTPNSTTGDSVVLYGIPGYQIEFYPTSSTDPSFNFPGDCKFYNDSQYYGITICMKTVGNDILIGIACQAIPD
jgi:hypothetical protein